MKLLKLISLLILLFCTDLTAKTSYLPPIGIPAPSFGIIENHYMYAGKLFKEGGFIYKDAGQGPYSHYIDNSAECQDFANIYGDKKKPRCSIPTDLKPGSVVEIHGGPYRTLNVHGLTGQRDEPIFIRGGSLKRRPHFLASPAIHISSSSFIIIENLITNGASLSDSTPTSGLMIQQPSNHISVRHIESKNYPMPKFCSKRKGGVGCWFATVWGVGGNKHWQASDMIEEIVLYKNHIHHNGDYVPTYESGRHAINISGGTRNIWILNNILEFNAEDGIQIYWRRDGSRGPPAEKVYIGRNIIRNNGENAVDIKQSYDVVVSENEIYGYQQTNFPASGSDGSAIVLNNDSPSDQLWVLNNRIHDSNIGIRSQTKGRAYVVGNLIYNISNGALAPTSPGKGHGVGIWSSTSRAFYAVNNTLYDISGGIYAVNGRELYIKNNIISHLGKSTGIFNGYHIALNDKNFDVMEIDHNLLFQPQSKIRIRGVKCEPLCLFNHEPQYASKAQNNFSLRPSSVAIGSGALGDDLQGGDVYRIFFDRYSINIKQDIYRNDWSKADKKNIGAFEGGTLSD